MSSNDTNPIVAVSGAGSIGMQHVRALAAVGCSVAVFDPSPEFRARASAVDAVTAVVDSFDDLLATDPAALIIAAPDRFHLPQLDAATAAGVTTMVEKPLAPSLSEAVAIADTIAARRVPVLMGYVLRHRQVLRQARALLQEGAIGAPTTFHVMLGAYGTITAAVSRFARPEPDRLYRDYSHEWDYTGWLFGRPESVLAVAGTNQTVPHVERPNLVDVLVQGSAGITGAIHLDYVARRGARTLHVMGTDGTMFVDIAGGTIDLRGAVPAEDRRLSYPEPASDLLRTQAAHLLEVAAGRADPIVEMADGIAALAVTAAAISSAASQTWTPVHRVRSGSSTAATADRNASSGAVSGTST